MAEREQRRGRAHRRSRRSMRRGRPPACGRGTPAPGRPLRGIETGRRPAGFTAPNSTSAMALPPSSPGSQAARRAGTCSAIHGNASDAAVDQHDDGRRAGGDDRLDQLLLPPGEAERAVASRDSPLGAAVDQARTCRRRTRWRRRRRARPRPPRRSRRASVASMSQPRAYDDRGRRRHGGADAVEQASPCGTEVRPGSKAPPAAGRMPVALGARCSSIAPIDDLEVRRIVVVALEQRGCRRRRGR